MSKQHNILLIEDNETHACLIKKTFDSIETEQTIYVDHARNGAEALEYLGEISETGSSRLPRFIVLDVDLPGMNGLALMEQIKAEKDWQGIPIVILSASSDEKIINYAYEQQASGYLIKPASFQELKEMLLCLAEFWIKWNRRGHDLPRVYMDPRNAMAPQAKSNGHLARMAR